MDRRVLIVLAAVVILGSAVLIVQPNLAISGYDGINSSVYRVNHNYPNAEETATGGLSYTIDPPAEGPLAVDVTGLTINMQIPNILETRDLDPIVHEHVDVSTGSEGETITTTTTKTWRVQIVELGFAVHVKTVPQGYTPIQDLQVLIRLTENGMSVFSYPDEAEAYILNIYTTAETEVLRTTQVSPVAGGIDLTINTIRMGSVPSWILESGYTGELESFKDVYFVLDIFGMAPDSFIWRGAEAEATFHIGFDVILFGYWEEVKTTREFERTPPTYWWEDMILGLTNFLGDLPDILTTVVGMVLVMVAIIGTVVVVVKVPNAWLKLFGVVAIWIAVLFLLAMFGVASVMDVPNDGSWSG